MTLTQPYLAHLTGVFHAPVQAWSQPDGAMGSGAEGIYCGDERVVSEARFTVAGHELRHISTQVRSATEVTFVYVVTGTAEGPDPLLTIHRTRRATVDGVGEELRIGSALREQFDLDLELVLGLDRTSMEQIKSGHSSSDRPVPDGPRWSWRDEDTVAEVTVDGGALEVRASEIALGWNVHLSPGASQTVAWSLRASDAAAPILGTTAPPVPTPQLDTTDQRLQRLADRAFSDLNSLRIADRSLPDAVFLAAGAPWFYTMFGRDSLIAARMLLPVDRSLAEGTLRALAARQGTKVDAETAEQPGKILHEVRRTDVSHASEGFHLPPVYYGTIDATPLWINLLHDTWRAGMPEADVSALLDNLEAALTWLGEHGDSDGDGFLEYLDTTGHGLANQGWKDSGDSIRWHDGTIAEGPIALCEVQAYAYEAALNGAALLDAFGRSGGDEVAFLGGGAEGALPRVVLVRGRPGSLPRARARRPEAAGRRGELEHRAPARHRHPRPRRAAGRGGAPARPDDVLRLRHPDALHDERCLLAAALPRRLGVVARHRDRHRRDAARRVHRGGSPGRRGTADRGRGFRLPPARAVRRPPGRRGLAAGPLPRLLPPPGLGRDVSGADRPRSRSGSRRQVARSTKGPAEDGTSAGEGTAVRRDVPCRRRARRQNVVANGECR